MNICKMFLVFVAFLCFTTCSAASTDQIFKHNFPLFGIIEKAANSNNQTLCYNQLKSVRYALKKRETWALRLLDSSGSPKNGFIWGNNYWMGTYSQCKWVSSKQAVLPGKKPSARSPEFPPFNVDFYVASFKQNSSYQAKLNPPQEDLILIGLCLPSACSTEQLEPLLTSWSSDEVLTVQFLYNFTMKFHKLRLIKQGELLDYPLLILFSLLTSAIVFLVIFATLYDIYIWKPKRELCEFSRGPRDRQPTNGNQWGMGLMRNIREIDEVLDRDNNLNTDYELKIDNFSHKSIPVAIHTAGADTGGVGGRRRKRLMHNVFICFSATSNVKHITEEKVGDKDRVPAIHGLRFLATIWVISLYTIHYLKDFADNKSLLLRISQGFSEQVISNSTLSVDTFFFTSGFLLSFAYYRNRRGFSTASDGCSIKRNVNEFCGKLLNTFFRLSPMYLIVLMIANISLTINNKTSLFEVTELSQNVCEKYWWRNLLYINNLFSADEMCMSWSWYLSTEMQFFMLGSGLLILSSRYWKLAATITGGLIMSSSLLNGYNSYAYSFSPTLDQQLASPYILHYPPWTRISPYLIGLCTGYVAIHLKGELVCNKATLVTCWTVASICNLWPLFGLYNKEMSVVSAAVYNALSRPAWGFGLSWVVVACTTRNAGIFNGLLSYPGWTPLSKLSFSAYLISPLIINLTYSTSETPIHLDFFPVVVYFVGFTGITYFSALVLSLLFEMPFIRMGKWLLGSKHDLNQLNQV